MKKTLPRGDSTRHNTNGVKVRLSVTLKTVPKSVSQRKDHSGNID